MDSLFFYLPFFLIIAGILVFIPYILYLIPKKLGYPKLGKILSGIFLFLCFSFGIYEIFRDEFFTKNNAKEFLAEQNIILKDDFKIKNNESHYAIGNYYHTFTLSISEKDKQRIIHQIKSSKDYKTENDSVNFFLYLEKVNKKIIQNYETDNTYVREYLEPIEGYAPTFRRISVKKNENELIFEDIDE